MIEKEIRVRTPEGEMTTFVVRPDRDGPFPVAVLFMDGVGYRKGQGERAEVCRGRLLLRRARSLLPFG